MITEPSGIRFTSAVVASSATGSRRPGASDRTDVFPQASRSVTMHAPFAPNARSRIHPCSPSAA